jgi:hypothetical protein
VKKHLRLATAAFAATTLVLAGCASDDDTTTDDTTTEPAADDAAVDDAAVDDAGEEMADDAGMEEEETEG